jgi:peptidoglycan-associated lipoprotein
MSDEICEEGECISDPSPDCQLNTVYFDFDRSSIRPDAESTLKQNLDCIEKYGEDATITLEGHADERGTNEYNIALGERRASSVKDYLTRMGASTTKLDTVSYGEERLARQCGLRAPDSCHQKNRRVEFVAEE